MATFGIVVRNKRSDGYYPVFIRVIHKSAVSYIKTAFVVSDRGLRKSYTKTGREKVEVSDKRVLRECMNEIAGYARRLNEVDNDKMTVQEITRFLMEGEADLSFSRFAEEYITGMINSGRKNSAKNYQLAVKRLHEFLGRDDVSFNDLSFPVLTGWIDSMIESPRKRNLYPTCIKTMYNAAMLRYNDDDRDIIKIRKNPFLRIRIPANRVSQKRSLETEDIRRFFDADIRESYNGKPTRERLTMDVCMMIFCLAGINAADLYDLPLSALDGETLCYKRKKTRDKSLTGSYTEIRIPDIIKGLFERYRGEKRLLAFSEMYSSADIFSDILSRGCKRICEQAGLRGITPYSFRHSWATIAINECGASMDDVAFALNHASAHKVTNIYIRPDYTRIDRLNEKVIDKVFGK